MENPIKTRTMIVAMLLLCIFVALAFSVQAQTSTCPTLRISASLGGCDNVLIGWTQTGSASVSSQTLIYGDGFSPPMLIGTRSYSRTQTGCGYSTAVTITQNYFGGSSCSASYHDNHNRPCDQCANATIPITIVSAASYRSSTTEDSVAAGFAEGLTMVTQNAMVRPLPEILGGVRIWVDARPAGIFFVSPDQINFHVPVGIPAGLRSVRVTNAAGKVFFGNIYIGVQVPSVFTQDGTGTGAVAADYGVGYIAIYVTGINANLVTFEDVSLYTPQKTYKARFVENKPGQYIGVTQINFLDVPINGQGAYLIVGAYQSQGFILLKPF